MILKRMILSLKRLRVHRLFRNFVLKLFKHFGLYLMFTNAVLQFEILDTSCRWREKKRKRKNMTKFFKLLLYYITHPALAREVPPLF